MSLNLFSLGEKCHRITSIKGEKFLSTLPNVYVFYVRGTVRVKREEGLLWAARRFALGKIAVFLPHVGSSGQRAY